MKLFRILKTSLNNSKRKIIFKNKYDFSFYNKIGKILQLN